jgi:Ca-activated chloride channel family protein
MVRKIVFTAMCVALSASDAALHAQQALPVFKSSVALVPISAVVRDGHGRTISTLTAADFEIRDNGEQRQILSFQADDATPLTIAVLVDTSGSMRLESKLASAREVVAAIAGSLRDGVDAVGMFAFDAALHELHGFTEHPASIHAALGDAAPFGATSLYDAIAETARRIERRPSVRRAIVVLTDGIDTSSALAPAAVSAIASAIDVPVYVVATVPGIDALTYLERASAPNARATADTRDLAQWTGGDLLWATSATTAASAARAILTELRHQYLIAVDSAADSSWRRLDVRVRNPRLTVRARSGYYGGSGPSR